MTYSRVLFQYFHEGTEEYHEKQPGQPVAEKGLYF